MAEHNRRWRTPLRVIVIVLALVGFSPLLHAAGTLPVSELRTQAAAHESKGQWASAALLYANILSSDKSDVEAREHYQLCLRHIHQARRLRDAAFRDDILSRGLASSLEAYEEILFRVKAHYVDEKKATPTLLFQHGVQELRFALEDPTFIETYLSRAEPEKISNFANQLTRLLDKPVASMSDARRLVREIALEAVEKLQVSEGAVVLEFAYGACNSLDEYTVCLTPSQYKDLIALQNGDFVGIGIDLVIEENRLLVGSVYPDSPAFERLKPRDQIVSIDGKPVDRLSVEAASAKLRGDEGTTVDLEIMSDGQTRSIKLVRRVFAIRTVEGARLLETPGVGYMKITGFTRNTPQEVREAIGQLTAMPGMKMTSLVIDLRDNGGGNFQSAIKTAELFLPHGVIASTQSRLDQFKDKTFRAKNREAYEFPLVILVNGETASAAELFAAALRDNDSRHARIVGRTNTFGKNTMQCLIPVDHLSSGMRITIARFFPPSKQDFSGCGLVPDYIVEVKEGITLLELLQAELRYAEGLAGSLAMMQPQ